ncbi:FliH/SctL family protein [Buchnera aphidicola (Ceratoglyphina bambusae)]|uniref:FliH/SctL family protein n=1 Tax=Buchnera aphidicola TaxID=9 RepID=UPI0031B89207
MIKLFYNNEWIKWNPKDCFSDNKKNSINKIKVKTEKESKILKNNFLLKRKNIYNKAFLKGKEEGYKLGIKKYILFKKNNKKKNKKIDKLFYNLKKSINSIDSYISIRLVKALFSILKNNNNVIIKKKSKNLITKVKKYLYKEFMFLNNFNFIVNPKDINIVKKHFKIFFKYKNWTLISNNNVCRGEFKIYSPEINVNFTNSDCWNHLYRIFLVEKNK